MRFIDAEVLEALVDTFGVKSMDEVLERDSARRGRRRTSASGARCYVSATIAPGSRSNSSVRNRHLRAFSWENPTLGRVCLSAFLEWGSGGRGFKSRRPDCCESNGSQAVTRLWAFFISTLRPAHQ
jgi:hypothetical protein